MAEAEPESSASTNGAAGADHGGNDNAGPSVPRVSLDDGSRIAQLEHDLAVVRGEKDVVEAQFKGLNQKVAAMRQNLGKKLQEDAEELDRRETQINQLTQDNSTLRETLTSLQTELESSSAEASNLQTQLTTLRTQSDSSSSDVLGLTREMRELRGEMERLRLEREEWENEAVREREQREAIEERMRVMERKEREMRVGAERAGEEMRREKQRAENLQEVLSEFQAAKESELYQATSELETQLRLAATSLSEYKLRAANAETQLGELSGEGKRREGVERELREKNGLIAKLRHDAVVNNEHLTEALRRLRKNSSDSNVDRRLVNNILLSFLSTSRADSKRFEMLSILATILSWDDTEREKAGLQKVGGGAGGRGAQPKIRRKSSAMNNNSAPERTAEEEAAMNESFSNLFVEFLLKEASQGQGHGQGQGQTPRRPTAITSPSESSSTVKSPQPSFSSFSPTPSGSGATTPASQQATNPYTSGEAHTVPPPPGGGKINRKPSYQLSEALDGR